MTYEEAIQKAAKLLRLAASNNPNEAALAAQRAQEIMDRFKIDSIAFESATTPKPDEEIKNFGFDPIDATPYATWKGRLCMVLAELNQAICYKGRNGICLIGRPSDVSTVRYIYGWLAREVEQLASSNCTGCGRTYANNYRIGVVETVVRRLRESQAETRQAMRKEAQALDSIGDDTADNIVRASMALVRVNNAIATIERRDKEVRAWQEKNYKLGRGSSSRTRFDSTARDAGRRDGHNVRLQPSRGNLGSGQRALSAS